MKQRMLASSICRGCLLLVFALALCSQSVWSQAPRPLTSQELELVKGAEQQRIAAITSVYPTVVAIYGNDRTGGGSGVLYDAAGFALTNHHVVAAAGTEGWAGLADGKLYRWKLIGTDPGGDVAIIRLSGRESFPTARLANSDDIRVGDWSMAMGNPFVLAEDQRPTVTLGIVSGIKRFQPGEGMNQLVYGNCIQVDSSINPGNSGGPLFDIRGRIMGINGRGSFEERGRVNVGLGYAISANQVKNFVPDLLATKIAQHGTLDAIFGTRGGQVVCTSINFDSPIARAGLELGDQLLEFEGETIRDANQFTNVLSTLPAGWPVTVTFRRGEERITASVRLNWLPYEPIVRNGKEEKPEPKEEDKPAEKEAEPPAENPSEEKQPANEEPKKPEPKKEGEQPEAPKRPPVRVAMPKLPLKDAGKIRDVELNKTHAKLLLERWVNSCRIGKEPLPAAVRIVDELREGDVAVGKQTLLLAADGRFQTEIELRGEKSFAAFDGKVYRLRQNDETKEVSRAKLLRQPLVAQAFVLSQLVTSKPGENSPVLEGSDKAQNVSAFRLALAADDSETLYLWLRAFTDEGRPASDCLKSGVGLEDDESIPATQYHDWKPLTAGIAFPHKRALVRGLAEKTVLEMVLKDQATVATINDDAFRGE